MSSENEGTIPQKRNLQTDNTETSSEYEGTVQTDEIELMMTDETRLAFNR